MIINEKMNLISCLVHKGTIHKGCLHVGGGGSNDGSKRKQGEGVVSRKRTSVTEELFRFTWFA